MQILAIELMSKYSRISLKYKHHETNFVRINQSNQRRLGDLECVICVHINKGTNI